MLQSTLHGWGAALRRRKTGCIVDPSLPGVQVLVVSRARHGSQRAEKSLTPGNTNQAQPLVVWEAELVLTERHFPSMALRRQDIVPSKTGLQDTCVILDTQRVRFLPKLVPLLATGKPNETHRSFLYTSLYHEVKHSTTRLGQEDRVTPCQTRHSGPSIDGAGQFRTLDEVRQGGTWTSMSSVLRDDKSSKFAADCHAVRACKKVEIEHTASRLVVCLSVATIEKVHSQKNARSAHGRDSSITKLCVHGCKSIRASLLILILIPVCRQPRIVFHQPGGFGKAIRDIRDSSSSVVRVEEQELVIWPVCPCSMAGAKKVAFWT